MIELIVGLANPGKNYQNTRHNAGAWFVTTLADTIPGHFCNTPKLSAQLIDLQTDHGRCRLAIPTVYMNESGRAVAAILRFYKKKPENMLIVHDDIDLAPGIARLKFDGGEGGHNGLRSIVSAIGTKQFYRLRIGVGHPGHRTQVTHYVLTPPNKHQKLEIEDAVQRAMIIMPYLFAGKVEKAMHQLHM